MTKEEAVEQFLHSLPKVYYFIRQHQPRKYEAVKTIGTSYSEGELLELNVLHFSTLWLIETLIEKEGQSKRTELKKLFLWKHPGKENTFDETVMDRLDAAGLIERKEDDKDRRTKVVQLTSIGHQLLEELREDRRKNVETLFSLLGIESEEAIKNIMVHFNELAENVWSVLREEALRQEKNNTPKGKQGRRVQES